MHNIFPRYPRPKNEFIRTKIENSRSTTIELIFKELDLLLRGSKVTIKQTPLAFYSPLEKLSIQKPISKCTRLTTLRVRSHIIDYGSSMEGTLIGYFTGSRLLGSLN
jgi:hypothetical protein